MMKAKNAPNQLDLFAMMGLPAPAMGTVGQLAAAVSAAVARPMLELVANDEPKAVQPTGAGAPSNFRLTGERALADGWRERAVANVEAIDLAATLEREGRHATAEEQEVLSRFIGFGAAALANSVFRDIDSHAFAKGWQDVGKAIEETVSGEELDSLARTVQYAHFTPEVVVRALWAGARRLGFAGGRVLDAGMGVGIFGAMTPEDLVEKTRFTGIEADKVTARIARLLHPNADVICDRFEDTRLDADYALAIGNPPYANIVVNADKAYRGMGLTLADYFIVKSIDLLRPGAVAAFVTSRGTMDKTDETARRHIAGKADLVAAIRLPDGVFKETAGTDVGADLLFLRRRDDAETTEDAVPGAADWVGVRQERLMMCGNGYNRAPIHVNGYFVDHPESVIGRLRVGSGPYGAKLVVEGDRYEPPLEVLLDRAIKRLPTFETVAGPREGDLEPLKIRQKVGRAAAGETVREGSFFVSKVGDRLMQIVDGVEREVKLKRKGESGGMPSTHVGVVRSLIKLRDVTREILKVQASGADSSDLQRELGEAYDRFVAKSGPINHTVVSVFTTEAGEERRTYRYPNLTPFRDDPDCWLVASLERYDAESDTAERAAIFSEVVVRPTHKPDVRSASDALAVSLTRTGGVDLTLMGELLGTTAHEMMGKLGDELFVDPVTDIAVTSDEYLSGRVREKLAAAQAAALEDARYMRNVTALEAVQPVPIPPSDITVQLGAPWVPKKVVAEFAREVVKLNKYTRIEHAAKVGMWTVSGNSYESVADSEWGAGGCTAAKLLSDALNNVSTQVTMEVTVDGKTTTVIDAVATEAARTKVAELRRAFTAWIWTDGERSDELCTRYNERFNNVVARKFDGRHLTLDGASPVFNFYDHQKRGIWRILASGSTYLAHAVGAGKTATIAAAVMEQRRLGFVNKALLAVPSHCLAQVASEFLALYPDARIIVADETNFARENRRRFLARAATGNWDCIIITHSALRFIPVDASFEISFIREQVSRFVEAQKTIGSNDRNTFRKLQAAKERIERRLAQLESEKDDFLTLGDLGVDQIIVDEAHEFRKLSFSTQSTSMKGVDADGSQMAWDLFTKIAYMRHIRRERAGVSERYVDRAVILASGTPLTNTMGEMYTVQRYMDPEGLSERDLDAFDSWSAAFGETETTLELQPSGRYKAVTRYARFINIPELFSMFRSFADVVLPEDLRASVKVPDLATGERQIITAPRTPAFAAYQRVLDQRIKDIERRGGKAKPGDDILLSVIGDGRHAAIDMRFVTDGEGPDDPDSKLNMMVDKIHQIHVETADRVYTDAKGTLSMRRGAAQMVFSDLGTPKALEKRGFSAYLHVRDALVARGIPASEIAFIQDCKTSKEKARLFAQVRSGEVRVIMGSSQKMGTGTNVQKRLVAMHHLDVPWIPSQIEQREGRIRRQGNENEVVSIFAYATLGSMDATMWQANERKARFISAVMKGDKTIRRLEDIGENDANQFAMAKAISSGDPRLMQKAGLEAEIARLHRLRSAHYDGLQGLRNRLRTMAQTTAYLRREIEATKVDVEERTSDEDFLVLGGRHTDPAIAGKDMMRRFRLLKASATSPTRIGTYRGFPIVFCPPTTFVSHSLEIELSGNRTVRVECKLNSSGEETALAIKATVAGFEDKIASYEERIQDLAKEEEKIVPMLDRSFNYADELSLKEAELVELDASLASDKGEEGDDAPDNDPSPNDGDDADEEGDDDEAEDETSDEDDEAPAVDAAIAGTAKVYELRAAGR